MFTTDGHMRKVLITELEPGMILRYVYEDGSSAPFTDVVVTRIYEDHGETRFDVARPYAFAHVGGFLMNTETVKYLGTSALSRYHLVLKSSGKPYTMAIDT